MSKIRPLGLFVAFSILFLLPAGIAFKSSLPNNKATPSNSPSRPTPPPLPPPPTTTPTPSPVDFSYTSDWQQFSRTYNGLPLSFSYPSDLALTRTTFPSDSSLQGVNLRRVQTMDGYYDNLYCFTGSHTSSNQLIDFNLSLFPIPEDITTVYERFFPGQDIHDNSTTRVGNLDLWVVSADGECGLRTYFIPVNPTSTLVAQIVPHWSQVSTLSPLAADEFISAGSYDSPAYTEIFLGILNSATITSH